MGRNGASGADRRVRPWRLWLLLPVAAMLTMAADLPPDAACPPNRTCHGCGCAGGPGYRGPDGHCVGYRALERICGTPPTEHCTFENAPGTGGHAACALRPRPPREHRSPTEPGDHPPSPLLPPAERDGPD